MEIEEIKLPDELLFGENSDYLPVNEIASAIDDGNSPSTSSSVQEVANNSEQIPSTSAQMTSSTREEPIEKKKRFNKFLDSWTTRPEFKGWLTKHNEIRDGHELAFCRICNMTVIAHKSDLIRHLNSKKHLRISKQVSGSKKIDDLVRESSVDVKVRRAELKLCAMLATNNLPFSLMDTVIPLAKDIFTDSEIVSKLAVRRTKASHCIKNALGNNLANIVFDALRVPGAFFSIIMDETTDCSTIKQLAFTVIYFNVESNKVETHFFDMIEVKSGDAISLVKYLTNVIESKQIPLSNLIGFCSDTTNVMIGEHNSVFSHLKAALPSIACIKCSCHLIHLAASKACLKLPRSVEDLIRNLGSHFSRSSFRQEKFAEFQAFFQCDLHKILNVATTRWLSVKNCVDRVLQQYTPLREYLRLAVFEDPSKTTEEMVATMDNEFTVIYLEFMSYTLGLLTQFNLLFQSETPLLYKMKSSVENLLKTVCSNYITFSYVKSCTDIMKIEFDDESKYDRLDRVYLGVLATESLQKLKNNSQVPETDVNMFLITCRSFYVELAKQSLQRFDFKDSLFNFIDLVNPSVAQSFTFKSLKPIFVRFPVLYDYYNMQEVDDEWREHALLDHESYDLHPSDGAEEYWRKVFHLKNALGQSLFPNLKGILNALLVLPFSNASVERVFSSLKNIKNDHRNKLKTSTIIALMQTKDQIKDCVKFEPTINMLKANLYKK
ncbi:unnamed protein product, partial [Brenthis ino]